MATKSLITQELDYYHSQVITVSDDGETVTGAVWEPVDALYKTKLAEMYKIKDRWKEIHQEVKLYVPNGSSVLDLGCGDKEILNTIVTNDYLGVDLYEGADVHHDLDKELLTWDRTWDVGLMVESLGFMLDPNRILTHYKKYATNWVITVRPLDPNHNSVKESRVNIRHAWTRNLLIEFLYNHFDTVNVSDTIYTNIETYGNGFPKPFLVAVCS